MKKALSVLLTVIIMLTVTAAAAKENNMNDNKYGFHISEDGTVMLEGKPFYGFGVNYFGAFVRYAEQKEDCKKDFINGLAGLASYNIPFIRMPLCAYYPSYYDFYDKEPEKVFSYMKEVLDECQKNHLGVVASLMWWDPAISAHVGEKRSDMGRPGSKTLEYAKEYTKAVVSRFADHPAVWGWEIGNEYNLDADLCDKNLKEFLWPDGLDGMPKDNVNGFDYYTSEELRTFYTEIASVIRKYDGYRMITTGNGEMRPFAYAIYKSSQKKSDDHLWEMRWDGNTKKQFEKMNEYFTPDPIDTVCFHLQSGTANGSKKYVLNHSVFGKNISSEEYFKAYYDVSKKLKKGCFFGEFGDMLDMEDAPDVIDKFKEVAGAISGSGIQIAALWQFQDYTDEGVAGQKLAVLSELNKKLVSEGKQETDDAWAKKPDKSETSAESETETETEHAAETVSDTVKPESAEVSETDENNDTDKKTNVLPYVLAAVGAAVIAAVTVALIKRKKK